MTFLPRAEKLGWARNPKFLKHSEELRQFLVDNCICKMDCPPDRIGECCSNCKGLTKKALTEKEREDRVVYWINDEVGFRGQGGCALPRNLRPFPCIHHICNYAYERLVKNDKT